jgi:hypothetical protein
MPLRRVHRDAPTVETNNLKHPAQKKARRSGLFIN